MFDQLQRGRIAPAMRVLDAGCGGGRNSEYLMRRGAAVFGVDSDPAQIERVRRVASEAAPELPVSNFSVGRLDRLPFAAGFFDLLRIGAEVGGELLDPLETTVVQGMRSMTTWVLGKGVAGGATASR